MGFVRKIRIGNDGFSGINRFFSRFTRRRYDSEALPAPPSFILKQDHNGPGVSGIKSLRVLALLGAGASGLLSFATIASSDEAEHGLACPNYPWPHSGILSSYDHASIRRGHQVYQQVCATCHSMSLISFRDLVGVAYTEEETKESHHQGPPQWSELCICSFNWLP